MRTPKQGWVSPRCIVSSKHGLLDGGQRGVESVINWSVGPVWLNGSPLWAGRRRAGGFGPDWWAARLSRPALGCQGQRPGGYRGRGVCRRAAAPKGPGGQTDTATIICCELYTPSYSLHACKAVMTNTLSDKSQISLYCDLSTLQVQNIRKTCILSYSECLKKISHLLHSCT